MKNHISDQNPFETALNAQPKQAPLYGRLEVDAFHVVLQAGAGRVPFDPAVHPESRRRTAINIVISPLPETSFNFIVKRQYIAEAHKEGWALITLPSLRELGVDSLVALNGSYVKAELVSVGSYTDRFGQQRPLTAPRILALYPSREECVRTYQQETGTVPMGDYHVRSTASAASAPAAGRPAPQASQPEHDMRAVAVKLLPALVKRCIQPDGSVNARALAAKIESAAIVRDYFDIGSDEVLDAISSVLTEMRAEPA